MDTQSLAQPEEADESCPCTAHDNSVSCFSVASFKRDLHKWRWKNHQHDSIDHLCFWWILQPWLRHWHSHKRQMNLVQVFAMPSLIPGWPDAESFKILLNNFVPCQPKNLCMSINLYKYSMCTHVANWPSRGLCDKVGPESHIMNALPRF